jgi:hypothetical protein
MRIAHPNDMSEQERRDVTRKAKLSVARLRLRYYDENPKITRGAAYEEAKRIMEQA